MFQTNSEFLSTIGQFAVVGFFLGVLYDFTRIFRIIFGTGKIFSFITDFSFMIVSGVILLIYAVETPTGNIRVMYVIAALFGVTLYFITIGKITVYPARLAARLVNCLKSLLIKYVVKPVFNVFVFLKQKLTAFFGELQQKSKKYQENLRFGLKKTPLVLYNENNNKMSKLCQIGGEERNVIKAKVRKKA